MKSNTIKYCEIVRSSSLENEITIKILYDNKLYKKVIGTLREELELYIRTLYLLFKDDFEREKLLSEFFNNIQWKNSKNKRVTDREMVDFANNIGGGWESISYKFACSFVHLSVLHNWNNKDIMNLVQVGDKYTIINYINQYHNAKLSYNCTFENILQYSLEIFKKIKDNMEYYLLELEKC